jgi:uncharacterized surface protein with fasciclin (FAS1) repeats
MKTMKIRCRTFCIAVCLVLASCCVARTHAAPKQKVVEQNVGTTTIMPPGMGKVDDSEVIDIVDKMMGTAKAITVKPGRLPPKPCNEPNCKVVTTLTLDGPTVVGKVAAAGILNNVSKSCDCAANKPKPKPLCKSCGVCPRGLGQDCQCTHPINDKVLECLVFKDAETATLEDALEDTQMAIARLHVFIEEMHCRIHKNCTGKISADHRVTDPDMTANLDARLKESILLVRSRKANTVTPQTIFNEDPEKTSLEIFFRKRKEFATFMSGLRLTEVDSHLKDHAMTMFVPTEKAFAKMEPHLLAGLVRDKELFGKILKHHIVPGRFKLNKALNNDYLTSLEGDRVHVGFKDLMIYADNQLLIRPDIVMQEHTLHIIDGVMIPKSLRQEIARLRSPFESLENALIPLMDTVAIFLDLAYSAFGIVELFESEGPFTLFVPTDTAFQKVDRTLLQELKGTGEKAKLRTFLQSLLVTGAFMTEDMTDGQSLPTVNGESLYVLKDKNGFTVNKDSHLVGSDLFARNGVIHFLDAVPIDIASLKKDTASTDDMIGLNLGGVPVQRQANLPDFSSFYKKSSELFKTD